VKVLIDTEVLEKLEWLQDEYTGVTGGRCHICGGYKWGGPKGWGLLHPGEFEGHKSDCKLALALALANQTSVSQGKKGKK